MGVVSGQNGDPRTDQPLLVAQLTARRSYRLSQTGMPRHPAIRLAWRLRGAVLAGEGGRCVYPCRGWPGPGGAAVTLAVAI